MDIFIIEAASRWDSGEVDDDDDDVPVSGAGPIGPQPAPLAT